MNKRLEILVEEPSMDAFLRGLLPRLLPANFVLGENCFVYPHEGKTDLQKRLPNRVRAYQNYPEKVYLLVVQDKDSADCIALKEKLINSIENNKVNELSYLVRIVCVELENWYLGDLVTLEQIYPRTKASRLAKKAKFRNIDNVQGSFELDKIVKGFSKTDLARQFGPLVSINGNRSSSFKQFCIGLQKLLQ